MASSVFPPALRHWTVGDGLCPPALIAAAPDEYKASGCAAIVIGGHPPGADVDGWLLERLAELPSRVGMSEAAAATLCVRKAAAFLWTAYYHPAGEVIAAATLPPPPR